MTTSKFYVTWCYTDGKNSIRRALHSTKVEPCIEAARLINGNPYAFEIGVFESDSGKEVNWEAGIGIVLTENPVTDLQWSEIPPAKQASEKRRTDSQVFARMDEATNAALPSDYIVAFESIATGTLMYATVSDPAKMGDRKKLVQMRGPVEKGGN